MQRAIYFVGTLSIVLLAQAANAQSTRSNPRDVVVESNRQELDTLLLRKPILTVEDKSAQQAVLKQINEDFKAVQVLNNQLMAESVEHVVDYKSLAELLAEIGSKASRLRSNLMLPKVDLEKQKERKALVDEAKFKDELKGFDRVVTSFATNPIFQKVNVIEVELARQASSDLSKIIDQSGRLKRAAIKLSK